MAGTGLGLVGNIAPQIKPRPRSPRRKPTTSTDSSPRSTRTASPEVEPQRSEIHVDESLDLQDARKLNEAKGKADSGNASPQEELTANQAEYHSNPPKSSGRTVAPRVGKPYTPTKPHVAPNPQRHNPNRVKQGSWVQNVNTMIKSEVDVAADVAAINAGRATRTANQQIHVNGRIYGYHPETGRLFPISGPGFVQLSRNGYKALGVLRKFADDIPRAKEILSKMHGMTDADIAAARAVLGI